MSWRTTARTGRAIAIVFFAALTASSGARAAGDPLFDEDAAMVAPGGPWDPLEAVNRRLLRLHEAIDRWAIDPLARGYDAVVPAPARRAIRRALLNLDAPAVAVNDLLQGSPIEAMITITRFGVNSTLGLAGLFDPAAALLLEPHHTTFADTLALARIPHGPYLILPLLGPTTARNACGYVVDFLFRPTTYLLTPFAQVVWIGLTEGSSGFTVRAAHGPGLAALRASALDYYAALRSAWWQEVESRARLRREAPLRLVNLLPALRRGPLPPAGSQIVDPLAQQPREPLEALAVED